MSPRTSRRRSPRTTSSVVALLLCALCAASARATTAPALTVHVKVTLTASRITLSRNHSARGYEVEFAVRNDTARRRVFSIGGKAIAVPARALRLTAISFQERGRYRMISRTTTSRLTTVFRVQ